MSAEFYGNLPKGMKLPEPTKAEPEHTHLRLADVNYCSDIVRALQNIGYEVEIAKMEVLEEEYCDPVVNLILRITGKGV